MQDVGAGGVGDVGAVVDGEELAVPGTGLGEDPQVVEFLGRLHALVAQLNDVHPGGQHGVQELREVALAPAGVGAEVEPGVGELGPGGGPGDGVGHAVPPVIGLPGGWRRAAAGRWHGSRSGAGRLGAVAGAAGRGPVLGGERSVTWRPALGCRLPAA